MTIITEQEIKETEAKNIFTQCNCINEPTNACLTCPKFFTDCPIVHVK